MYGQNSNLVFNRIFINVNWLFFFPIKTQAYKLIKKSRLEKEKLQGKEEKKNFQLLELDL